VDHEQVAVVVAVPRTQRRQGVEHERHAGGTPVGEDLVVENEDWQDATVVGVVGGGRDRGSQAEVVRGAQVPTMPVYAHGWPRDCPPLKVQPNQWGYPRPPPVRIPPGAEAVAWTNGSTSPVVSRS
jgi:hypothetical protein